MKAKIFTSEEILKGYEEDCYFLDDYYEIKYRPTKGEIQWMQFTRGKYCIADYLWEVYTEDDEGNPILTINFYDMSVALKDDGMPPKAVCLSDEAALQHIFFYNYIEVEDENS